MTTKQFHVRGIEFNEPLHWRWDKVEEAVAYMVKHDFNTLANIGGVSRCLLTLKS